MSVEQELKRTNDFLNQLVPSINSMRVEMQEELGKVRDQITGIDKKVAVLEERVSQVKEIGRNTGDRLETGNEVFQELIKDQVVIKNELSALKKMYRGTGKRVWEIAIILFTIIATVLLTKWIDPGKEARPDVKRTESPGR